MNLDQICVSLFQLDSMIHSEKAVSDRINRQVSEFLPDILEGEIPSKTTAMIEVQKAMQSAGVQDFQDRFVLIRSAVWKRIDRLYYLRRKRAKAAVVEPAPAVDPTAACVNEAPIAAAEEEPPAKKKKTGKHRNPLRNRKDVGARPVLRKPQPPKDHLSLDEVENEGFHQKLQSAVMERKWEACCDADFSCRGMGRGVVALRHIAKNEIVVDYHGQITHLDAKDSFQKYMDRNPDSDSCYVIEVIKPHYLIDATSEDCEYQDHDDHRCLGRLCNNAHSNTEACNLKLVDIPLLQLSKVDGRYV